ncbi:nucleoside-diphosphate-sugar epimerase [Nocardia transvalensis]|uniref:Nucleoside-diphosphate-sugar epimerase n=1 Tax=Nocardia transvalensis TaxID=37333 RepID=A0A7W9UN58_9NOCA|nr:NAD(P)H-binding protein [Nocardia transvalensis]MBB5918495.1 nucleoside-diphosphate-sugar epimerase [Nocardia transvalensis]
MRLIVFGANGRTGRVLTRLALDAGHDVVAVTRQPAGFPLAHERLTVVEGDVHQRDSVYDAVAGGDAVVSALGVPGGGRQEISTYSVGAENMIAAMRRHGIRRIVVVSSAALDPKPYSEAGFLFNRIFVPVLVRFVGKTLYADMRRMEELLAASGLDWTAMRPGGLYDLPEVTEYTMAERHVDRRYTARIDLADCMLRQVSDDRFVGTTVGVGTAVRNPSLIEFVRAEALGGS